MTVETTRQKVEKLFTPATLERLNKAGLMVVDKQDFETVLSTYKTAWSDPVIRARLRQLQNQGKE